MNACASSALASVRLLVISQCLLSSSLRALDFEKLTSVHYFWLLMRLTWSESLDAGIFAQNHPCHFF